VGVARRAWMLKFWSEKSSRRDYLGDTGCGGRMGLVLGSYAVCVTESVLVQLAGAGWDRFLRTLSLSVNPIIS